MPVSLKSLSSFVILRDAFRVTCLHGIGRALGVVIPFAIARWFGADSETDAFMWAFAVVMFLASLFTPNMERLVVPFIAESRSKGQAVGRLLGNVIIASGATLLLLGSLAVLLTWVGSGADILRVDAQSQSGLVWLLSSLAPLAIVMAWASIIAGSLNADKRFTIPALSPSLRAVLILVLMYVLRPSLGVYALVVAYLAGEIARLAVLASRLRIVSGVRLTSGVRLDPAFFTFVKTSSHPVMAAAMMGLVGVIDRTMASWLEVGSVSVLHYADRLHFVPFTVLAAGLVPVVLAHWSQEFYSEVERRQERLYGHVSRMVIGMITLGFAAAIVLVPLSGPITELVFGHGAFPQALMPELRTTWLCFALGLGPQVALAVLVNGYVIIRRTRVLLVMGAGILLLHVVLNPLFMALWGVAGIAVTTAVAYAVAAVTLLILFPRRERAAETSRA